MDMNMDMAALAAGKEKYFDILQKAQGVIRTESQLGCENLSDEFSQLIQLAAQHCTRFASDILYDIDAVRRFLSDSLEHDSTEEPITKLFVFGFRENGIDHETFVKARLEQNPEYLYNDIWGWLFLIEDSYMRSWLFPISVLKGEKP